MKIDFTISVIIPDDKATKILEKMTDYLGYRVILIDGSPNPQTRKQYLEVYLKRHLKDIYEAVKANEGGEAGRLAAIAEAEGDMQ